MIIAVCVDNRLGTSFHGRRLSRDRELLRDLGEYLQGSVLWIAPKSEGLIRNAGIAYRSQTDYLLQAGPGQVCFAEGEALLPHRSRIEGLILYHWMRDYPYDTQLDLDPGTMKLLERKEFAGYSHDILVREVYDAVLE